MLDFDGVNVVSNSFADECLAKLLLTMSFDELKQRTTFVGVNDFARKNITIVFRRRLAGTEVPTNYGLFRIFQLNHYSVFKKAWTFSSIRFNT